MESYRCVVYDEKNKRRTLNLKFNDEEEVLRYAKENKFKVSSVKKSKSFFEKKVKDKDLKLLCKQIEILFKSGCEITKLFDILKFESNKKMRELLTKISEQIEKGSTITEAFNSTNSFSKFFISTLYAGEISSNLDAVMGRLSQYYDKEAKLKQKILTISIYPIILLVIIVFMMLFMLFCIIPKFEDIYLQNGVDVPMITTIMINLSRFMRANYLGVFLGFAIFTSILVYILKTNQEIRISIYKKLLKMPIIGQYLLIQMTSKFSKALYILTQSGLDVVTSIEISARVIDKEYIYDMICTANRFIKEGNGIGVSLNKINLFPKLFTNFLSIGENTGRLDEVLNIVNEFYEKELDEKIELWMKLFEYGVLILMGIIVAAVLACILIPMFNTISSF